ncbi:MAG: AAA family ATPase [Gloeotrichia echinulata CP02]
MLASELPTLTNYCSRYSPQNLITLILVENPEAHLHPRGQAKMGELLALAASCGIQVVIETHSDHVLNGIRLAVHGGKNKAK